MLDLFDEQDKEQSNKPIISEEELSDAEVLIELKKIG